MRDESNELILFFAEEGGSNLFVKTTHVSLIHVAYTTSKLRRYILNALPCTVLCIPVFALREHPIPIFTRVTWWSLEDHFVTKFLRYFTSSANRQDTSVAGRDDGEVGQVVSRSVIIDTASACADSIQLGTKLSTCLLYRDRPEDIGEGQFCEQDGPEVYGLVAARRWLPPRVGAHAVTQTRRDVPAGGYRVLSFTTHRAAA